MHAARFIGPLPTTLAKRKSATCSISRACSVAAGIGHRGSQLLQVGLLHAVASPVAVREAVERRHRLARDAALDRHDQLRAIELGGAQVRAVRHLAVHLAAVGRPPVTRLAVSLLPVDPQARRNVLRRRNRSGLRARRRGSNRTKRQD